ncbi:MAG: hypothetical protein U1D31_00055 [Patescibacteria group bacterium]|nr:hypothetical protein [bacterium]MDZ4240512.1 hypothetical protein [Patescibacteria group bacterium]
MNFLSHRFLFITGALVVIMPFLGFPALWKTVFYVIIGLYVIFLSFSLKGPKRSTGKAWVLRREKAFVENSPSVGGKKRVMRKKVKEETGENIVPAAPVPEPISHIISDITPPATEEKQNGTLHGA